MNYNDKELKEVKTVQDLFDFQELRDRNQFRYDPIGRKDYSISSFNKQEFDNLLDFVIKTAEDKKYMWNKEYTPAYYEMQLFNRYLGYIISEIIKTRNKLVSNKTISGVDNIYKHMSYLETLEESITTIVNLYNNKTERYFGSTRMVAIADSIGQKALEIQKAIQRDQEILPQYIENYQNAQAEYRKAKSEYENQSRFKKVVARINGEKKNYDDANRNYNQYTAYSVRALDQKPLNNYSNPLNEFEGLDLDSSSKYIDEFNNDGEVKTR